MMMGRHRSWLVLLTLIAALELSASLNHLPATRAIVQARRQRPMSRQRRSAMQMCELLGMSCARPTDCCFSLAGFTARGGRTGRHDAGWGLAFYEGRGLRTFLDVQPACSSPIAELLKSYPIKTLTMLSHIRLATKGAVCLENVHPFSRELWGVMWSFCHNGDMMMMMDDANTQEPGSFNCVGDTDSELFFTTLLTHLKRKYPGEPPPLDELFATVQTFAKAACERDEGAICNFLLSAGEGSLFAFSWPGARPGSKCWNGLHYTIREPPFTVAHLTDVDLTIDFAAVTTPDDRVAVIATCPLTDNEKWTTFERGELILFHRGEAFSSEEEIREAIAQPCSTLAVSHLQTQVQMAWADVGDWQEECKISYNSSMI